MNQTKIIADLLSVVAMLALSAKAIGKMGPNDIPVSRKAGKSAVMTGYIYKNSDGSFYFLRQRNLLAPHFRVTFAGRKEERQTCISDSPAGAEKCPEQSFSVVPARHGSAMTYAEARPLTYGNYQRRASIAEIFGKR